MLKKFTFWLSKNTEFTTSLDVFLSLFLLFSLCLDEVPPICWMKLPNVDEIPPNHIRKKNVFFLHIHEANMGSSLVVLYTSLWLVEGVYKPQACVGWASVTEPCMWIKHTCLDKVPPRHPTRFSWDQPRKKQFIFSNHFFFCSLEGGCLIQRA